MPGGLTLSLKPGEKFLVGGCLVENGPKKSSIRIVDENVLVLRLSDALHPDEIKTPVTRAYHVAQSILASAVDQQEGLDELLVRLEELKIVFERLPVSSSLEKAIEAARAKRYHAVLNALKSVIGLEAELLERLLIAQQAMTRKLTEVEATAATVMR